MARQAVLERLGWTFARIRGSHFYRDPDAALEPIFRRLEELEIPPQGQESSSNKEEDALGNELKERVIRRADEIRRQWRAAESTGNRQDSKSTGGEQGVSIITTVRTERAEVNSPKQTQDESRHPAQEVVNNNRPRDTADVQPPSDDIEWVNKMGPYKLRRLHRWAKEKAIFQKGDVSTIYWLADDLARRKRIWPANARKVRRLYERAVSMGFSM